MRRKTRKKLKKINIDNVLFYSIVSGILLLSFGVYIMGSGINRYMGKTMLILGSGIFYISVIIFTFRIK